MTTPGRRVLVCDDELHILRALKVVLRDADFDVVATATVLRGSPSCTLTSSGFPSADDLSISR